MENERSKEWVLAKVKKLLTLGRNAGASEGERDNAMRMAHNLLVKYNMSEAEAEAHGAAPSEPRGFVKGAFYGRPWARVVASSVAKLYFCEYVYCSATRATDTEHYFFGKQSNATVASAMAQWIVESIRRQARKEQPYGSGNVWVRSFSIGAANMVYRRVERMMAEAKAVPQPGMSLVLSSVYAQEKQKNQLIVKEKFPKMHTGRSGKKTGDIDAHTAGRQYGATINLNRQVGGETQKRLS